MSTLSCLTYGREGPAFVILHGGSGRAVTARPLAEQLAETMRVWAPDLPGHGDSSPTPGEYQLRTVARRGAPSWNRRSASRPSCTATPTGGTSP